MWSIFSKDKEGVTMQHASGKQKRLLNVNGKAAKAAKELRDGIRYTNDYTPKYDKTTGEVKGLTREQRAYRSGYLAHASDSSIAYCKRNRRTSRAAENRRNYYGAKKANRSAMRLPSSTCDGE